MTAPRETRDSGEAVRNACLEAALAAYEDAGLRGLCGEGRWEVAVQAIRDLDLARVLRDVTGRTPRDPPAADPPRST